MIEQMNQNKFSLKRFIPALLSFLLCIGAATIFHPCEAKEDGTWMHCHDVQTAVIAGSIFLTALLIGSGIIQSKRYVITMHIAAAICSGAMFFLPGIIMPMCMMHTMRCYAVMQPFVRIMSALVCIFSLLETVKNLKKE